MNKGKKSPGKIPPHTTSDLLKEMARQKALMEKKAKIKRINKKRFLLEALRK